LDFWNEKIFDFGNQSSSIKKLKKRKKTPQFLETKIPKKEERNQWEKFAFVIFSDLNLKKGG